MMLDFKRGSIYTRNSIYEFCYGEQRPAGGDWDTGYTSLRAPLDDQLIVFMNIGVPGSTGHDFPNTYDDEKKLITWYGKPGRNSKQEQMRKIIDREVIPHFFARWNRKPEFIYIGVGSVIDFEDGVSIINQDKKTIEFKLLVNDIEDIFAETPIKPDIEKDEVQNKSSTINKPLSSFALEKHLEDYLVKNWSNTVFSSDYDFYERQYQTNTGPLDILAKAKDGSGYLILELKRDLASDAVVGQTLRYMGYIKEHLANENEEVRGCIVASQADDGLRNALLVSNAIDFYEYNIEFNMKKVNL